MSHRFKVIVRTLRRHVQEVRGGGWSVLFRKNRSLAKRILSFPLIVAAAPLVLLIVLVRPLVFLRFGTMLSQRIGHFTADVEAYLCTRDREKPNRRTVDIIGCPEPVSNIQVMSMWKRTLRITPGARLWKYLDEACRFWTRGDLHHVSLYARGVDYKLFLTTETHLSFTDGERRRGQALLQQLGIPSGASWVCIHNRDAAYLDGALGGRWAYHDYRDFSVQTMVAASAELSRRGYFVVRVGSIVEEALASTDPKIIDYANSPLRSDFMDIYLLAHGAFFVGSDSGLFCVPLVFRKPVINTNMTVVNESWFPGSVLIYKRMFSKEKQRCLTLREMFEAGLWGASETGVFSEAGVEIFCNTPEEIRDAAIEVDDRLKGQWVQEPEDEALQQRFWDIFRQFGPPNHVSDIRARVGAAFLRKHVDLLN